MKHSPLLVGQLQKGCPDLIQVYAVVLVGGCRQLSQLSDVTFAPRLSLGAAPFVDEDVMQDRKEPGPEMRAGPERIAPLVSPHEGVVDQVLGLGLAPGQRTRIAAQGRELADDVKASAGVVHTSYTTPSGLLIPTRRKKLSWSKAD